MVFGITGNSEKEHIWAPVESVINLLLKQQTEFVVAQDLAPELRARNRVRIEDRFVTDYVAGSDVVLSFGGDGTLLNTVHEIGDRGVPVLGVNLGRLGFLALVDESRLAEAISAIAEGASGIEERRMLRIGTTKSASRSDGDSKDDAPGAVESWGLNEVVITRSGVAGLLTLDVFVNDRFLNSYWADGLIVATPTGSTAYNLSAGGPIITPGSACIAITPLAPHSLTERPIVVPLDSSVRVSVQGTQTPYVVAVDGRSSFVSDEDTQLHIEPSERVVRLVTLPGQSYFETLRTKLMWGSPRKE